MSTFRELSKTYADKILAAIKQDQFQKTQITPFDFKRSATFEALQEIRNAINNLTYEDKKGYISDADKSKLYKQISEQLNLPSYRQFSERTIKATSNDELTDLINIVNDILRK